MKELNKALVLKDRGGISMLSSGGASCGCSTYGCGCSKLYDNIANASANAVYCGISDEDK